MNQFNDAEATINSRDINAKWISGKQENAYEMGDSIEDMNKCK